MADLQHRASLLLHAFLIRHQQNAVSAQGSFESIKREFLEASSSSGQALDFGVRLYGAQGQPLLGTSAPSGLQFPHVLDISQEFPRSGPLLLEMTDLRGMFLVASIPESSPSSGPRTPGTSENLVRFAVLGVPLQPVLYELREQTLYLLLLGGLLAVIWSLILHRALSLLLAPLGQITQALKTLRFRSLVTPQVAASSEELRSLFESFNMTTERFSKHLGSIQKHIEKANKKGQTLARLSERVQEGERTRLAQIKSVERNSRELQNSLERFEKESSSLENLLAQGHLSWKKRDAAYEELKRLADSMLPFAQSATEETGQLFGGLQEISQQSAQLLLALERGLRLGDRQRLSLQGLEQQSQETSQLARDTLQMLENSKLTAQRIDDGLRRGRRAAQLADRTVRALDERIKEIKELLAIQEDAIGQTHLLALNAAITASQAGEEGQNFALVAEEIRDLAERSSSSIKEVGGLIQNVHRDVGDAMNAIEDSDHAMEESTQLGQHSNTEFDSLLHTAELSSKKLSSLHHLTQEPIASLQALLVEMEDAYGNTGQLAELARQELRESHIALRWLGGIQEKLESFQEIEVFQEETPDPQKKLDTRPLSVPHLSLEVLDQRVEGFLLQTRVAQAQLTELLAWVERLHEKTSEKTQRLSEGQALQEDIQSLYEMASRVLGKLNQAG